MNGPRLAPALAALLICLPGWAQTAPKTEAERSSLPARTLPPAELLSELLKGGYILYFRHAATDLSQNDERMKSYEDCANQRNLIDRGRSDARAAAAAIRHLGIPVERVLASPFCRTGENGGSARRAERSGGRGALRGPAKNLGHAGTRRKQPRDRQPRKSVLQRRRSALPRRG